jgi:hypothetical protein
MLLFYLSSKINKKLKKQRVLHLKLKNVIDIIHTNQEKSPLEFVFVTMKSEKFQP